MDYLDKIKAISSIKITQICKDLQINRANLLNGRTTKENEKKVYDELKRQINEIISNKHIAKRKN